MVRGSQQSEPALPNPIRFTAQCMFQPLTFCILSEDLAGSGITKIDGT
jgi:hypothetical protein